MRARKQTTEAQLNANRSNAQHSTGPTTPEGKAKVAQNATKHGRFSRNPWAVSVLPGEDAGEYDAYLADLLEDCAPEGRREEDMVRRLAALTWRLARVHRAMEETLTYRCTLTEEEAAGGVKPDSLFNGIQECEDLHPHEVHLSRELSRLHRDLAFLQRYRQSRADRLAARESNPIRHMDQVMAQLDAEARELNRRYHLEEDEAEDDDREDAEDGETDPRKGEQNPLPGERSTFQRLKAKSAEQTQSEDAETPPKPGDGSNDLT